MARLIGPDESVRLVYLPDGRARAQGLTAALYADADGTVPADVLTLDGDPIVGSQVAVNAYSQLPLVQYPDGVDVIYGTVNGGPLVPLYARTDDRLDSVSSSVAGLAVEVAGKRNVLPSVTYLDAYNSLFGGVGWVTGQGNTATTLSAAVTAGATSVQVASAAGISTGVLLVVGAGTPQQQLLTVTNVAGSVLTVSPAVASSWPSGQPIAPVWTNSSHITADGVGGSRAYGYWLANAKRSDGSYVFGGGPGQTIVWLGDSWTAEAIIEFEAELDARLGDTTVVNAGIPGNRLSQMIARFATDVAPHNPDVVVLEYGVNDVYAQLTANQMATELQQAVMLCQAIGARVVIPGMVPLADHPAASADRNVELRALASSPEFPSAGVTALLPRLESVQIPRNASSLRLGAGAQPSATGLNNIAVGPGAQAALTTGASNTAVGNQVQNKITTANFCTGVGQGVQFNATGGFNTAVGSLGQFSLTTGLGNTAIGYGAQYAPAGATANATTTANYQTVIGYQAGQADTTQSDRITAVGYWATASGASATALGAQATATNGGLAVGAAASAQASGSVAIGRDNAGVGATATLTNQMVLGTDRHTVEIPGTLRLPASTATKAPLRIPHGVAPTSPVDGDMWTTSAGLFVRIGGVTRQVTVT